MRCARAAAAFGPDIDQAALLADARFQSSIGLSRACSGMMGRASATKFFMRLLGLEILHGLGRTETREKFSRVNSLPTVRSCIFTPKWRAISSRRSQHRQHTTL